MSANNVVEIKKKKSLVGGAAEDLMKDIAGNVEDIEAKANYDLREIPLVEIEYHPQNRFKMRDLEKLAQSMKENGQLHNAVVRIFSNPENPKIKYQMLSGERRHRAAGMNGWTTLYCKVIDVDDMEAEKILLVANLQNRDLDDMERSDAVTRLFEIVEEQKKAGKNFGGAKTRDIVAKELSGEGENVSGAKVQKLKNLSNLIPEFQEQVRNGTLSLEKANQFAQMPKEQQKLVYDMLEEGKNLTAETAKKLKDELRTAQEGHEEVINRLKEDIKKKEEETLEFKQQAEDAASKLKRVEDEKKKVENELRETGNKLKTLQEEQTKAQDSAETEISEIRKQIEEEVSKQLGEQNAALIQELQGKLEEAINKGKAKETEYQEKIEALKEELEKKGQEQQKKVIEEKTIEGNMEITALAKQAEKLLTVLLEKIGEYTGIKGFELTDQTKEAIAVLKKKRPE